MPNLTKQNKIKQWTLLSITTSMATIFFYVYVYWNILIQYNQKEKEKLALRTLCFSLV
jgi:hypothetical protein